MRRHQVERVVLDGGQPDCGGGQSQRGVVGNDEHRPGVRRSHREAERGADNLVVGGVDRQAVLVQQRRLDAVHLHPDRAAERAFERLAQIATGVESQPLNATQDVAGRPTCRVEPLLQPVKLLDHRERDDHVGARKGVENPFGV